MTLSNRSFTIISISAVVLICISMAAWNNGWLNRTKPVAQEPEDKISSTEKSTVRSEPGREWIGGVLRPGSDLKTENKPLDFERDSAFKHVGSTALVEKDTNPATKKIAAAIKNKNDPDRRKHLTVMASAKNDCLKRKEKDMHFKKRFLVDEQERKGHAYKEKEKRKEKDMHFKKRFLVDWNRKEKDMHTKKRTYKEKKKERKGHAFGKKVPDTFFCIANRSMEIKRKTNGLAFLICRRTGFHFV